MIMNSLTHAYDEKDSGTISIHANVAGDRLVIEYRDDGKGIESNHLNHIFEPFFTTRRGQGGSGLGLSIIYNIVTATLKGTVAAESSPGEGVCFRVSLPIS